MMTITFVPLHAYHLQVVGQVAAQLYNAESCDAQLGVGPEHQGQYHVSYTVFDEQAWIGKSQACCMLACGHILLGKLESTSK